MLRLTNLEGNGYIYPIHSPQSPIILPNAYTADSTLGPITWRDGLEHVLRTETSWVWILVLPLITTASLLFLQLSFLVYKLVIQISYSHVKIKWDTIEEALGTDLGRW